MPPADPTRFVLVGTSHPGNVGAAARAMKVMGFSDLVLVAPRHADVLVQEDTVALASGAADILVRARVVATLAEALEGVSHACATAMTPRDFGPRTHAPRGLFPELAAGRQRVGFVFGSERYGLSNEDVYRCHSCLSIPTPADYGSLNLAQAVRRFAGRHHAVLLANHGPVVAGSSLSAAADAIEELEATAKLHLTLHGRACRCLTPEQVAELKAKFPA